MAKSNPTKAKTESAAEKQQKGTSAPTAETYVVEAAHGLNLRKAPKFGAKVLTILPNGAPVSVALGVEAPAGWLPVLENDEVVGWVYARYLKKIEG